MIQSANSLDAVVHFTDVAIVGAGASGLSLASRLNRNTIVIDGGGFTPNPDRDVAFAFETTGLDQNAVSLRRRLIGGAAAHWSGRCAEMNDVDFKAKPWANQKGWPIGIEALTPYYEAAWQDLGLPSAQSVYDCAPYKNIESKSKNSKLSPQFWQYAFSKPECAQHLGQHFIDAFANEKKKLITHIDAIGFVADGHKIDALKCVDRSGRIITIKANTFILATGCIEASRFLLDAGKDNPELIGPVQNYLGKGFHQHILLDGGSLFTDRAGKYKLQRLLNRFRSRPSNSLELGLRLSSDIIMERQLIAASATMRYTPNKRFKPTEKLKLGLNKFKGREPIFDDPSIGVEFSIEQVVDMNNKISLGTHRDPNGQLSAVVNWSINELELRSAITLSEHLAIWMNDNKNTLFTPLKAYDEVLARPMRDSLHHMGGTQMSADATTGVVDINLKLHGAHNLYVTGGSTFPTGGHVNPTLTMIALSMRLADHLNGHGQQPFVSSAEAKVSLAAQ